MRAIRRNARRTWPDGSGCEQRPLHPCSPGCPGWGWFDDEVVQRCDDCAIFDDDEDAGDHIAGCGTCLVELRRQQRGDDVYRYTAPPGGELPPYSQRKTWAAWANRNGDPRRVYPLYPASDWHALYGWLTTMDPNGDYRDLSHAEIWEQIGHFADNYPEDD